MVAVFSCIGCCCCGRRWGVKKKKVLRVLQGRCLRQRQWERPVHRGYYLSCCECGLTHRFNFRVVNGDVEFQVFRAPRATAALRKRDCDKILEWFEILRDLLDKVEEKNGED